METFSREFKKAFFFAFTRELIRNSVRDDILKKRLQEMFEPEEKQEPVINLEEQQESRINLEEKPVVKIEEKEEPIMQKSILSSERINEIEEPIQIMRPLKRVIKPIPAQATKPIQKQIVRIEQKPHLFIPELKLPSYLEYLKPIPAPGIDIDLYKLNPLIKDPAGRIIEVNPDERVIVTGTMGTKATEIILNREDIDRVINKFSEVSMIPVNEGVYRIVVGNLIFSAIISGVIGAKFVIKKMMYPNHSSMQGFPPSFPQR
jgi:hypothetical protein